MTKKAIGNTQNYMPMDRVIRQSYIFGIPKSKTDSDGDTQMSSIKREKFIESGIGLRNPTSKLFQEIRAKYQAITESTNWWEEAHFIQDYKGGGGYQYTPLSKALR